MKIRNGFVSNSSSSSFIIDLNTFNEKRNKFELNYNTKKEAYIRKPGYSWEEKTDEEKAKEFDDGYQQFLADVYNRTKHPIIPIEEIIDDQFISYYYVENDKVKCNIDPKYNVFNMQTTSEFKYINAIQMYYFLKPVLRDKNARLNILIELQLMDDDDVYIYENNIGSNKVSKVVDYLRLQNNERRRGSVLTAKYSYARRLKEIDKLLKYSDKQFFDYILKNYFMEQWCLEFKNLYNKTKSKILKNAIELLVISLNRFSGEWIKKFHNENKDGSFIELEYSDGGGCGPTNKFLHNGNIINDFKTLHICNH